MQCNISLSIYRIPGHLIFQLHCEFFNTSVTIPVKICFWQVIFLSNWGVDQTVDFLSHLEAHLFLGTKKNRSPFPYPLRELSITPWEESWLIWHGSIVFLLIWGSPPELPSLVYSDSHFVHKTIPRTPDFSVLCSGFFSGLWSLPQSPIWAISPQRSRKVGDLS